MKNRIKELFERKANHIASIYMTAGFPLLDDTLSIVSKLDRAGVDMIEIGFPFSDPLADGPVIQQSNERAIANGMTLQVLFEQLKDLRSYTQLPVLLMGYLNPVMQYGLVAFVEKCSEIGIDGIIIPDMPLNFYLDKLQESCRAKSISNILLISPQTSAERMIEIDQQSDGFIYMVSSNSVTGTTSSANLDSEYLVRVQELELKNPRLIGFGIHDAASFKNAAQYSNGCIVGSAFIKHLDTMGSAAESIEQFVKTLRL